MYQYPRHAQSSNAPNQWLNLIDRYLHGGFKYPPIYCLARFSKGIGISKIDWIGVLRTFGYDRLATNKPYERPKNPLDLSSSPNLRILNLPLETSFHFKDLVNLRRLVIKNCQQVVGRPWSHIYVENHRVGGMFLSLGVSFFDQLSILTRIFHTVLPL
jgi:hypothetical protein